MNKNKQLVNYQIPSSSKDEKVHAIMKIQSLPEEVVIKSLSARGVLIKNKQGKFVVGKKV